MKRPTRTSQPYRQGRMKPNRVSRNIKQGRTLTGYHPLDRSRRAQRRKPSVRTVPSSRGRRITGRRLNPFRPKPPTVRAPLSRKPRRPRRSVFARRLPKPRY